MTRRNSPASFVFFFALAALALALISGDSPRAQDRGGVLKGGVSKTSRQSGDSCHDQEEAEEDRHSEAYKALQAKEEAAEKRRIQGHQRCRGDEGCERGVKDSFEAEDKEISQEARREDEEHNRRMEEIRRRCDASAGSGNQGGGGTPSGGEGERPQAPRRGGVTGGSIGGRINGALDKAERARRILRGGSGRDESGERGDNPPPVPEDNAPRSQPSSRPCDVSSPPEPPPPPPAPAVCNLQELAALVFERYDTGEPIRVVRVANRPNTYLLLLSGTELHDNEQATGLLEDFLELENSSPSLHREWAKYALRSAKLPPGSRLILAGHSLGGMVAQHLALDGQIWSEFQLRPERVILFGSPNVAPRVDGARYVYVEHAGDLLLNRFNREHQILGGVIHSDRGRIRVGGDFREVKVSGGGGTPDPLWGYHSLYHQNLALKNYDLQGAQLNGRRGAECLQLDLDFSFSYTAPNLDNIQNRVSETIGEIGMEKEAQRLRYEQLLPPSRASNRRQGYDGVYWDTKAHAIVIGEAKGGGAVLGTGYGFRQGTIEWARAAARAITRSRTANNLEVRWAEMILCSLGDYDVYGPVNPSSRGYFCSSLGPCKPPVRVELFTTENKNGLPGRTTHKVLARYP